MYQKGCETNKRCICKFLVFKDGPCLGFPALAQDFGALQAFFSPYFYYKMSLLPVAPTISCIILYHIILLIMSVIYLSVLFSHLPPNNVSLMIRQLFSTLEYPALSLYCYINPVPFWEVVGAASLSLLLYYMVCGRSASFHTAGTDLLTKNRFNLPPLPHPGKLMRVTWPF